MLLRTRRGLIEFGRARLQPREAVARIVDKIAKSPGGLKYLRGALVETSPTPVPENISRADLIKQVHARLIEGALTFVFLRPYEAPTPGFTVEGEGTIVVADQKNEAGDLKPAPEVPPEYPVLARVESDQVIESTAKLVSDLAALLFNSFARERRQSTIGRTLVTTAQEQSQRIQAARRTTDVSLEVGKWPGGGLGRPAPTVPETYVEVASGTANSTKSAIASLGSSFASMLHAKPFVRPRSTPAPTDEGG